MTTEKDEGHTNYDMGIVAEEVKALSPKQLEEFATLVQGQIEERDAKRKENIPQLGRMNSHEYRDHVLKAYGFDPGV